MNKHLILETAAHFNAAHDYNIDAALHLTSVILRQAHLVQLARKEQADPHLTLSIEIDGE